MSYNTRRSNPQQNVPQGSSAVGQRRPAVSNNFVPGGQLNTPQKQPLQQQQQQIRSPQQQGQQQSGINFRAQSQPQQQQGFHNQFGIPQQARTPVQVKQETPQPKTTSPPIQKSVFPGTNPPAPEAEGEQDKKKFWKIKGGKISKTEKVRRRNVRLSKILQPKNAIMILNELVKGCTYNVDELPVKVDSNQFRGTVLFDDQEFVGTGRTKSGAKNAAAEVALKHLVKNKQFLKKSENDEDQMEVDNEETEEQVMPWSHIASFAMYKLFCAWGEDPNIVTKIPGGGEGLGAPAINNAPREPKPARKMPDNPQTMNPMMLMNQMLPGSVWNEVGKHGNPPNVSFTYQVTVGDKHYCGTGSSKKAAKKLAAFAACHDVLKVNYPSDLWSPLY
ncbi:double-stranded RNA-specific editase Adar-like isoform X2 [Euwallacea similis]|uniref:double-stranded RNA-specific editase Adar-like isoform X2 n=1 Tax=Euwallacea similis TaxID=1736056 RepID=UPI00344EF5B6